MLYVTINFVKIRLSLFLLSFIVFATFTLFSYSVAKEVWQQIDFDTTVKLQDKISRKWDGIFSYFSFIGSVEVTLGLSLILALWSLTRAKFWAFVGWLLILPASFFEVFGKLVVFHPAPPVLFHRSILETGLPSFYIHTNFSYPSGHMTRTSFLLVVFLIVVLLSWKNNLEKMTVLACLIAFGLMMFLTRIYLGEHWLSDVLGGSLLGVATGLFSASLILAKKKRLS